MNRPETNIEVLPANRSQMLERLRKEGVSDPESLRPYEREFARRKAWSKRSKSIPDIDRPEREREVVVKERKRGISGFWLLLPAAAIAGLGVYYSGMGKALLDTLPDYSGSVRRIGSQAALPATTDMGLSGTGTGGFTPPTPRPAPPASGGSPAPMGDAGRRPL